MAVEIPLSQGYVAIVDDEDAERVLQHKWCAVRRRNSRTLYAQSSIAPGHTVQLHRFILEPPADAKTDHRDGDGLNNRRSNLRVGTQRLNMQNKRKPLTYGGKQTLCRFKGVSTWQSGRFVARITDKVRFGPHGYFNIGSFDTEEDAAKAYDACARLLYGEHGRYNFPRPGEQSAHSAPLGGIQDKTLAEVDEITSTTRAA